MTGRRDPCARCAQCCPPYTLNYRSARLANALSITSPIGCQALPSNCTSRICLIGWKSAGPVLIAMPGSIRALVILQRCCLPHDVLARQIVAALGQHLNQGLRRRIAEDGVAILLVAFGIIFVHERQPILDGGVFLPGGIAGVLQERGRYHANGILKAGRPQRIRDRSCRIDQQEHADANPARPPCGSHAPNRRRAIKTSTSAPESLRISIWVSIDISASKAISATIMRR